MHHLIPTSQQPQKHDPILQVKNWLRGQQLTKAIANKWCRGDMTQVSDAQVLVLSPTW